MRAREQRQRPRDGLTGPQQIDGKSQTGNIR